MKGIIQQMEESPVFTGDRTLTRKQWDEILKKMNSQGEPVQITLHHVPKLKPLTNEQIAELWKWLDSEEATESLGQAR